MSDIRSFRSNSVYVPSYEKIVLKAGAGIFTLITVLLIFTAAIVHRTGGGMGGFLMVGGWASITATILGLFLYASYRRYKKLVRVSRFAASNGLAFTFDRYLADRTGMIFDKGTDRKFTDVLSSEKEGWEIGNYTYTTGSGKSRTQHYFGYIKLTLDRTLPHMVLDAKANNMFGFVSNLPEVFDRGQTLSLEGDFDKYFTLYAPAEYKTDALYVFTPDVMACLIDEGKKYDMEVIDNVLYIYSPYYFNLLDEESLANVFSMVSTIGSQLRLQTKRYADGRVMDRSLNIVAPEGKRLKGGFNWVAVGVIVLFVLYQLAQFSFFSSSILLPIAVIAIYVIIAIASYIWGRGR